ncbi:hypothetical protein RIF29_41265 [Crotalaria pallida]|uniref:Uncharacterized protein n=1 Tax=Crotalaria pallida TaxID=3830 RepID=A0AAN9EAX4_CROPI
MCSNTGHSACGCDTGANGGASIWSSGLKKQLSKKPRVPKRGPGVAELEKILREQETIDISSDRRNVEGFIPHHHHSNNPYHHHHHSSSLKSHPQQQLSTSPPSHRMSMPSSSGPPSCNNNIPMPSHVPLAPKFDHLGPTTTPSMTSIYGHNTLLPRNSGSGLVLPEKDLFPMNNTSSKSMPNLNERFDVNQSDSGNSSSSRNLSYPAMIQKKTNQYPPPMMNQFLGSGNPTSSSGSLPIGLRNHTEHPSNQSTQYNSTSRNPEQHKMVSMKPSHPPSLENSLISPSNFQASPIFSQFNRPHQSSTNEGQAASGFTSANESYRDANRKFISDIGVPDHANLSPFATPEVPPPPMHLFQSEHSKGNAVPYQVTEDRMDRSYQHSESRSDNRPFFNFLDVNDESVKGTRGPNHGGHEANGGVDLSLKL